MTRLVYDDQVSDDLQRIVLHLQSFDVQGVDERVGEILSALSLLMQHPLIGRPAGGGLHELVIGRDARGDVARYRFDAIADIVHVLALRAQREAGFQDD
jgi:toxin ParE1/3/4